MKWIKRSIAALMAILALAGCKTTPHVATFNRIEPFVVVPHLSKKEVSVGETISVRFVVYNTSDEDVLVPDPSKFTIATMNFDTEDPTIWIAPFSLGGPAPKPPKPEILLPKGGKIEATKKESFSGDGVFLVSAWGYQHVRVPITVTK